jgi:NTE family protein
MERVAEPTSNNGSASIAVVLPGGGARGAYEIGAMSVILPRLAELGLRVSAWCGTSAGAINATLLASLAHLPPREQAEAAIDVWLGVRRTDVLAPVLGRHLVDVALRLGGEMLGVPGVRFQAVLDARPLKDSLLSWIDWDQLHANVRSGAAGAVCVMATALGDDAPVAFVEGADTKRLSKGSEEIRYVATRLGPDHVRASAAIPVLFPAVRVTTPASARGYYVDGGTRLNTPLKPALDLGAGRIVIVGFEPLRARRRPADRDHRPHLGEIVANVLDGLLLDQVNADLRRLAAINLFFAASPGDAPSQAARVYRESRGRDIYRRIACAVVTPSRRRELGEIADRVFREHYGGWRGLLHPDYLVLGRLLGAGASRGELLSFLLFDERFIAELIEAGRRDARRWLARQPKVFSTQPAFDLDLDHARVSAHREEATISEWRTIRRTQR